MQRGLRGSGSHALVGELDQSGSQLPTPPSVLLWLQGPCPGGERLLCRSLSWEWWPGGHGAAKHMELETEPPQV